MTLTICAMQATLTMSAWRRNEWRYSRAHERILEVVSLLEQVGRLLEVPSGRHLAVPDVPLVERDMHPVEAALEGAHVVDQPAVLGDDRVELDPLGEEGRRVVVVCGCSGGRR